MFLLLIPSIFNTLITLIVFFGYIRNTNYENLQKNPRQSEYYDWDEWRPVGILMLIFGLIPYINLCFTAIYLISGLDVLIFKK